MRNSDFLAHLGARLTAGERVVWIVVAAAHGSVPRAPGARMLVGVQDSFGTIGGGQLELRAIGIAREMLAAACRGEHPAPRLERFPLGARVGQCCGGVVQLAFDLVAPPAADWVERARALERENRNWLRLLPLATLAPEPRLLAFENADTLHGELRDAAREMLDEPGDGARLAADGGQTVLLESFRPPELHLALFGAGHVGRALVETLAHLPLRVSWIDARETEFPAPLPGNVRPIASDCAEAEVRDMAPGAAVLIMTHSHALDYELVRAWLDRGDFRFLGLIGSKAKRASFARRLRAQGYREAQIVRLVCPVGVEGVVGKEPGVIAVAIAAQLMRLRRTGVEQATRTTDRENSER